jgi:hypothetical protein
MGLSCCTTLPAYASHRFDVGSLVQLVCGGQVWTVMWRGLLKVPGPTGVKRRNVYLLNDTFWDTYYEEDLEPACPLLRRKLKPIESQMGGEGWLRHQAEGL